MERVSQTD